MGLTLKENQMLVKKMTIVARRILRNKLYTHKANRYVHEQLALIGHVRRNSFDDTWKTCPWELDMAKIHVDNDKL